MHIFQILIGLEVKPLPWGKVEKLIFLFLALLSIIYSNIFFTALEDMKIVSVEMNFNSFQDLTDSRMEIFRVYDSNDHDSEKIKNIFSNATKIKSEYICLKKLLETRNVICVTPYNGAKFFINKHLNTMEKPIMKIAGPTINNQFSAFPYRKASPFAEKFDETIRYIKETGLHKFNDLKSQKVHFHPSKESSPLDLTLYPPVEQLLIVLFIGYILAIFSFFCELSCHRISSLVVVYLMFCQKN